MAKPASAAPTAEAADDLADGALLDVQSIAVKKLIARGNERGYVTYDEVNAALPQGQVSSEQIEDTMAMLSERGINVVEAEEAEDPEAAPAAKAEADAVGATLAEGDDAGVSTAAGVEGAASGAAVHAASPTARTTANGKARAVRERRIRRA